VTPRTPSAARMVPVVAAGGVIGALARYGLAEAIPHRTGHWPWAILLINVSGGLLIGILMGWLETAGSPSPVLRPFLGVGVLGGYTTLSTSSLDGYQLLQADRPAASAAYLAVTLAGALLATAAGGLIASAWWPVPPEPGHLRLTHEPELGP
jgi:CrcB protein